MPPIGDPKAAPVNSTQNSLDLNLLWHYEIVVFTRLKQFLKRQQRLRLDNIIIRPRVSGVVRFQPEPHPSRSYRVSV